MKLTAKHVARGIGRWNDEAPMMEDPKYGDIWNACVPNSVDGARALYDKVGGIVMEYMGEVLTQQQLLIASLAGMDEILDIAIQAAIIATLFSVDEALKD